MRGGQRQSPLPASITLGNRPENTNFAYGLLLVLGDQPGPFTRPPSPPPLHLHTPACHTTSLLPKVERWTEWSLVAWSEKGGAVEFDRVESGGISWKSSWGCRK
ncbi:hypothetical protein Pcinc_013941 [Petrolisthes cinctipes]|uniref:Uncharacterized protein n=1 Tax=Petrolisthes cinctipes TaxID=88211 RepID=A0AAE1G1F4_PETCI|nr:hypothetical protein Pcinc_013941 [Petrolisthes cinctipes]